MAGDGRAQVQRDEDILARRRVLGEDHPDTLTTANGLAVSLRAVGGHPGTVTSASNAASIVLHRGEHQAARELGEDTWPAAAASWARTTPTPFSPPSPSSANWPSWASTRRPRS